jgi:tRNA A37 threonylcarbamoyladenosine dehydratase
MIYKLRKSVKFYEGTNNDLHIFFINSQKKIVIDFFERDRHLFELLGCNISKEEIINKILLKFPKVSVHDIENYLNELKSIGVIEENECDEDCYQTDSIYSRQMIFWEEFENSSISKYYIQDKLENSHVTIIGLGGIGSWIAYNLVQLGVNKLTLMDNDTVELSNLNRQALYFRDDVGELKTVALRKNLTKINPKIQIIEKNYTMKSKQSLEILDNDVDLVINCADYPDAYTTGLWVTKYCVERKIPNINGIGYNGNIGRIGTTNIPNESLCWVCINENTEKEIENLKEIQFGIHKSVAASISPISSMIASIHSIEALKILVPSLEPSFINKTGKIDFITLKLQLENKDFKSKCSVCGYAGEYQDVLQLNSHKISPL